MYVPSVPWHCKTFAPRGTPIYRLCLHQTLEYWTLPFPWREGMVVQAMGLGLEVGSYLLLLLIMVNPLFNIPYF